MMSSFQYYGVHVDIVANSGTKHYHLTARGFNACYIEFSAEEAMTRATQINMVLLMRRKQRLERQAERRAA